MTCGHPDAMKHAIRCEIEEIHGRGGDQEAVFDGKRLEKKAKGAPSRYSGVHHPCPLLYFCTHMIQGQDVH